MINCYWCVHIKHIVSTVMVLLVVTDVHIVLLLF